MIARLNVGGPARHVTILDRRLAARGFQTLLAHGEIGPEEASLEQLIEDAGIPSRRIPGLGRRVSPLSDLRAFVSLVGLIFRQRPDIVHTHTAKAGTLGRIAALLYNLPRRRRSRCLVVHTFHGHVLHGYFGEFASAAVRAIERALGFVTDCIVVLSERQRQDIADRYRIAKPDRVRVVPLGLELDLLTALAPRTTHDAAVVFGFVGRFVPIKNLPLLIEAFARVHREVGSARLLLVGDGESRASVEALVAQQGLTAVVKLGGWRADLASVYGDIDVLVLTSLNEGTPVAAIEAMAAGLPVVATDVGGVSDVIVDGCTGLVVPSASVEPLAAAMLSLARSSELRRRLGVAAREAVRTRFSAERLASNVAALYDRELSAKRYGSSPR